MSVDLEKEIEQLKFQLERTKAVNACRNLMGTYVWNLMNGTPRNCTGLWARREDSRVEMSWGVYDGYDGIRRCYDVFHEQGLEDRIGHLPIHTLTSEVLEVAEDGKTARAVWISPGLESHPDDNRNPVCNWAWIKYGADFICEDGVWYLWHMTTYGLFLTNYYKSWGDTSKEGIKRDLHAMLDGLESDALPSRPPVNEDWVYSVDKPPCPDPAPPAAYSTWDEIGYGY